MSILPNSPLNIKIIALEIFLVILAPIWILKLFHYFVLPMPFIYNSSSVIPTLQNQAIKSFDKINFFKTFTNILLFGTFFIQHIVMAKLSYKIRCSNLWSMFPTYQRLIYNIVSSILLIIILEYQEPQNYIVFTMPLWISLPLAGLGAYFLFDSNSRMQESLLLPYTFQKLFNSRQIELKTNNYDQIEESGITIKGSYSFIRHPMQSGSILLFTFANTTFTFEKIIAMIFMTAFIYIGVTMQEQRLVKKYKQYENYMKTVKQRFIPYLC